MQAEHAAAHNSLTKRSTNRLHLPSDLLDLFKLVAPMDFRIVAIHFIVAVLTQGSSSIGVNEDEVRLTAPHQHYACPEGANVTLVCEQHGHPHAGDQFHPAWLYTPHLDRHCQKGQHPRGGRTLRANRSLPLSAAGIYMVEGSRVMLRLIDVRLGDQGRYCCLVAEKHHKGTLHSHVLLTVGPRREGSLTCTEMNTNNNDNDGKVTAVFATAACIMAFLCLPLILVLVYRQRQTAQANRRAHELVRMDSEAQGHDNPVFLGGSPQAKTRTVSQIMTRQSSETGRHLLSDPGTPLTPAYGDVFFPMQEPIPESPNILQV
ncbi:V-type immunoglobulin domain-containing suppressor of T-cell activation [Alosa sapidissima]|uniref:V-type immunoglobulin domain-containing suppressor of T-cell activation n=1 Tax=Alosa sapidissima TaxID=34773 RepID=UPI001C081A7E|nr:V-type immunoglobulin domain-containing suppressor of T-cell activation [Alosa sapidissima]